MMGMILLNIIIYICSVYSIQWQRPTADNDYGDFNYPISFSNAVLCTMISDLIKSSVSNKARFVYGSISVGGSTLISYRIINNIDLDAPISYCQTFFIGY